MLKDEIEKKIKIENQKKIIIKRMRTKIDIKTKLTNQCTKLKAKI